MRMGDPLVIFSFANLKLCLSQRLAELCGCETLLLSDNEGSAWRREGSQQRGTELAAGKSGVGIGGQLLQSSGGAWSQQESRHC